MKTFYKIILYFTLSTFTVYSVTGCATVFKGATDTVNFASEPTEADLYVNGTNLGKTPLQLELKSKSKDTHTCEFKKQGYETKAVILYSSVGAGWVILDIVFLLLFIPIIVDAASGNWFEIDQNYVKVNLEEDKEE